MVKVHKINTRYQLWRGLRCANGNRKRKAFSNRLVKKNYSIGLVLAAAQVLVYQITWLAHP